MWCTQLAPLSLPQTLSCMLDSSASQPSLSDPVKPFLSNLNPISYMGVLVEPGNYFVVVVNMS